MKQTIRAFIANELLSGRMIEVDDNLLTDGMIDSLGVIQLVAFIDDRFHYTVPFADITIENFGSVNRLEAYLESQLDGAA